MGSDGTSSGTVPLKDLIPGVPSPSTNSYDHLNIFRGALYFGTKSGTDGALWKTDGTPAGTLKVKDVVVRGSVDQWLTPMNGAFYFSASDGVSGFELWKSDGTAAGTVLVKDIYPGIGDSTPSELTPINGKLFFTAYDGTHGNELWVTDGTAAGTRMVKDITPGSNSFRPRSLMNVNGLLFFTSDYGALWRSDGTEAGTVHVKDIAIFVLSQERPYGVAINGTAYYCACGDTHGYELWKSDGSTAGTVLVKDIQPENCATFVDDLANMGGTLVFSAFSSTYGLWKSDGTAAGTVMIKALRMSGPLVPFERFLPINGEFYFRADDGVHGFELWKTDGTTDGTVLVSDVYPGADDSRLDNLTEINGTLFFTGWADARRVPALMRLGEKVPVELSGFAAE